MDFTLTHEQQLLRDSLRRLMSDQYSFEHRSAVSASDCGWSRSMWRSFAELGFLGIGIPESFGGVGGGPFETMIVMEELGRAIALEPYVSTVVMGANILLRGGSEAQKSSMLPAMASGDLLVAIACTERQSRFELSDIATTASETTEGWRLNGVKTLVWHGDSADRLFVTARLGGDLCDPRRFAVFVVDAAAQGVVRHPLKLSDGTRGADITLTDVLVARDAMIGQPEAALSLIDNAVQAAIAATVAESIGAMDVLLATTVDYLKTRRQFGRAIGSFQVLQHRAVDMLMHVEQSRSMAIFAASLLEGGNDDERRKWMSGIKAHNGRACRFVGEQAVQLHGGIGITMASKVSHYFRRLTAMQSAFGDADHHLELFSRRGQAA